jgi:hypothetical protein
MTESGHPRGEARRIALSVGKLGGVVAMKITGRISKAAIVGQADKYKRFAEQCRELGRQSSGQLKQTLEEMAKVWDDLARGEDNRDDR